MPATLLAPTPTPTPRLVRALDVASRAWNGATVLRASVPVATVDVLAWLASQPSAPSATWHSRDSGETSAAWGAALVVDADRLGALALPDLPPDARLYGGARFAPSEPVAPEWAAFGRVRLTLPRIELRTDADGATLAVHLAPGEAIAEGFHALDALAPVADRRALLLPQPLARRDAPDRAGWADAIGWALAAFDDGRLDKVVLARRSAYRFGERLDALDLMRRLQAGTPRCFHAVVAPGDGSAFLSATPERLFRLHGREVATEAVAGTRPRASGVDDRRLRDELLGSDKEQREHAYVRDAIVGRLAPLTSRLDADAEASAMTLARGRHLYTGIRATLADGATALVVLRALHPTPAVGGTPRAAAEAAIARLEPFDRGLYAGPVGWIGRDADGEEAAEFAVGIRSGLVRGDTLSLYAGAGLVAGSDADAEWAEIEHKATDFARVFGLDAVAA